jgi:hypothetical protein
MSVPPGHPRCFRLDGRLFVVPSWSELSVAETRDALTTALRRPAPRRPRGDGRSPWGRVGAVAGALGIVVVAVSVWEVTSLVALAAIAASGAVVGAALALGTRRLVVDAAVAPDRRDGPVGGGAPATVVERDPGAGVAAVEVPGDVAASAPDDATGDELALWSALVSRYRDAREALLTGVEPGHVPGEVDTDPAEVSARIADAEAHLRAAEADYGPVARLLGLPAP